MERSTTPARAWILACAGLVLTAAMGLAQAELLGVAPQAPSLDYSNTDPGTPGVTYDANTGQFSIDGTISAITGPLNLPGLVNPGTTISVNVVLNSSGELIAGAPGADLVITGGVNDFTNAPAVGVLIEAEATGFGFSEFGPGTPTDLFDMTFTVTGGTYAALVPNMRGYENAQQGEVESKLVGVFRQYREVINSAGYPYTRS